jgi:hypothetical protein
MDQSAQDPALEARVGRLEVDTHEVKSAGAAYLPTIARVLQSGR